VKSATTEATAIAISQDIIATPHLVDMIPDRFRCLDVKIIVFFAVDMMVDADRVLTGDEDEVLR
jgi:hypothetical protein